MEKIPDYYSECCVFLYPCHNRKVWEIPDNVSSINGVLFRLGANEPSVRIKIKTITGKIIKLRMYPGENHRISENIVNIKITVGDFNDNRFIRLSQAFFGLYNELSGVADTIKLLKKYSGYDYPKLQLYIDGVTK